MVTLQKHTWWIECSGHTTKTYMMDWMQWSHYKNIHDGLNAVVTLQKHTWWVECNGQNKQKYAWSIECNGHTTKTYMMDACSGHTTWKILSCVVALICITLNLSLQSHYYRNKVWVKPIDKGKSNLTNFWSFERNSIYRWDKKKPPAKKSISFCNR